MSEKNKELCPYNLNQTPIQTHRTWRYQTWPRCKKKMTHSDEISIVLCPCHLYQMVQGDVRRRFHETFPAAWLLAEGGGRRQAWKIVTMATSLLVQSGSAVLPLEYSFIYPPSGAPWAMDRFIPSSRQPQHWSRNYHGSQERRRSIGRQRGSPDSQEKDASSYRQGVTLRAEDLLVDSENKLGSGSRISPFNHLAPKPGDPRRAVLGGSANEVAQRARAQPRRSSEGTYALRRRRSSSSSSNAADDPTSSDPSSSQTTSSSSSSSSSESGCNADSETCNYCRLSESSEGRESSSTDDDRNSSPTPPKVNGVCRRLTRALSEDCDPPSRPIRRTSPGEYLRYKRDQMERLRSEQQPPARRQHQQQRGAFQRCDSDPRLSRRHRDASSPSGALTFVSPTRNRIRRSTRKPKPDNSNDDPPADKVILPVPPLECGPQPPEPDRPRRSALAKNLAERRSRSHDGRPGWNATDESATPFLQRRASFRCAVCDCDIPFTNCVLCNAEDKTACHQDGSFSDFCINEADLLSLDSEDLVVVEEEEQRVVEEEDRTEAAGSAQSEKKELEEFYDHPTPVEPPSLPPVVQPEERRNQWTSKGAVHKSFNQEEQRRNSSARRSSLRKYNSEPVPDTEEFRYSREQSGADTPASRQSSLEQRVESSASNSSKSESRSGYHVVKDSPKKDSPQQQTDDKSSCHVCSKTTEDEESSDKAKSRSLTPEVTVQDKNPRKSPVFLKPEFDFEPEIIHKANPLVDEADVDVLPTAVGAFRRLSEEEFISTLNIHDAAKKGDLHVVKLLTKKDPKQMETVDERGWTPIHLAAACGHTEVVKYLAMEGAHLAALDPSSYTAIHLAAMNGHNSILEVLLPMGVDIDSVTAEGFTALHLAVMNCHLDCIQTLLQWGSSLEKRDALGRGIHDMVEEYNLHDVAELLRRFHKQLHNFKHMLDMMNRDGRNSSEMPREFMDMLASIAEESGPE